LAAENDDTTLREVFLHTGICSPLRSVAVPQVYCVVHGADPGIFQMGQIMGSGDGEFYNNNNNTKFI